jgi:hypothetical protein
VPGKLWRSLGSSRTLRNILVGSRKMYDNLFSLAESRMIYDRTEHSTNCQYDTKF